MYLFVSFIFIYIYMNINILCAYLFYLFVAMVYLVFQESLEIIKMSPDSLEEIKTSIAFYKVKLLRVLQCFKYTGCILPQVDLSMKTECRDLEQNTCVIYIYTDVF